MSRTLVASMLLAASLSAAETAPLTLNEVRGTGSDRIVAHAELSAAVVELSGELRLTLTVEGPSPLRVMLPSVPLNQASAALWKTAALAEPTVETLDGGRERSRESFRLFPFVPGETVTLMPAVFSVRAGTAAADTAIEWNDGFTVQVRTAVLQPDPATLRAPTGIEHLPPPDTAPEVGNGSFVWLVAILVLALGAGFYLRYRWARQAPVPNAREVALRDLSDLVSRAADPHTLQVMADIMRRYVASLTDVAAIRLTTQELLVALRQEQRLAEERLAELQAVLEAGDLAKFAGSAATVDASGFTTLHEQAVRFVERSAAPIAQTATSTHP